jgi:hypothetical protein
MHRRVGDHQLRAVLIVHNGRIENTNRAIHIGLDEAFVQCRELLAERYLQQRADGADGRLDFRVGRRDDLSTRPARAAEAGAEVDLVSVVLRRIVARGHHDAGTRVEHEHRVGKDRRRQYPRHEERPAAGASGDAGGLFGESAGVAPTVVPDHQRPVGVAAGKPRDKAGRRLPDDGEVHPVRTGSHRAPEPGSAERERSGEPIGEFRRGLGQSLDDGS